MDDKIRSSGTEPNEMDDSPRRRRTPSAEPSGRNELKSKRRSRSRSVNSHSRSPSRDRSNNRRRRSRSRGHYSPDSRYGRQFSRGGYQRDSYNRRRAYRSPNFRNRNRNARRSRSTSYDRYKNRRNASTSRDRSLSQGRGENSRVNNPTSATAATNYPNDYAPTHFQPEYVAQHPTFPNAQQFGSYDYVPMMQPPPTSFPAYPPPSQEYIWNAQVPPPPIISCAPAAADPSAMPVKPSSNQPINSIETDEEQQKRQAAIDAEKKIQRDTIRKQRDDYIRRASALKRELITLKEQREELTGDAPPSPTTNGFILENDRLQRIWSLIHCARLI